METVIATTLIVVSVCCLATMIFVGLQVRGARSPAESTILVKGLDDGTVQSMKDWANEVNEYLAGLDSRVEGLEETTGGLDVRVSDVEQRYVPPRAVGRRSV